MENEARGRRTGFILTVLLALCAGEIPAEEPWSVDSRHPSMVRTEHARGRTADRSSHPFALALRVWSELLTRIDGPRCAHRPSCAAYAHRAVERYGILLGVWMALNRLTRGARSSALRDLPWVRTPGGGFFLDRLEDGRFWEPGYLPISGR